VDPGWAAKVKISVVEGGSNKSDAKYMESSKDDDFMPVVSSTRKSDHEAILIEIT
jgi:hypothetical protein